MEGEDMQEGITAGHIDGRPQGKATLTSYELNVFLFVEFSSNKRSKRRISQMVFLVRGVNTFTWRLSMS